MLSSSPRNRRRSYLINTVESSSEPRAVLRRSPSSNSVVERLSRYVQYDAIRCRPSYPLHEVPGGQAFLKYAAFRVAACLVSQFSGCRRSFFPRRISVTSHTLVSELIKGIISAATASSASGLAMVYSGVDSNLHSRGADTAREVRTPNGVPLRMPVMGDSNDAI